MTKLAILLERAQTHADKTAALAHYRELFGTFLAEAKREEAQTEDQTIVETAILETGALLAESEELYTFLLEIRELVSFLPKAKTAKIVRRLIDLLKKHPRLQRQACVDTIDWCVKEKRGTTYLRQRMELKLAQLDCELGAITQARSILEKLISEVRKLEDKPMLVECLIEETKMYLKVANLAKAKASLTAAKANANSINCPVMVQAEIDLLSGIVSLRESDSTTAYSYFYEASEAASHASAQALESREDVGKRALRYMVLAKIVGSRGEEAISLASEKLDEAFMPELSAIAKAQLNRSLEDFEKVVISRAHELEMDGVVVHHLKELNERLLEDNLMKLVQPYSRVEIDHIAKLIQLPVSRVLSKLSEMILDGKLLGTLDQGVGVLVVFEKDVENSAELYSDVLKVIGNTSLILDTLGTKANLLVV